MTTVTINGKPYISSGGSITVVGNRVIIDGKDMTFDANEIRIEVTGNVGNLSVNACNTLHVKGSVGDVSTQSGDVTCGDVKGSVSTMSGDIRCGSVGGNAKTMSGDISRR